MLQVIHLADDEGLVVGLGVEAVSGERISWREAFFGVACFIVWSGARHTEFCEVRCCAAVEFEQIETSCRPGPRSQAHKSTPSEVSCGRSLHFFQIVSEPQNLSSSLLVQQGDGCPTMWWPLLALLASLDACKATREGRRELETKWQVVGRYAGLRWSAYYGY